MQPQQNQFLQQFRFFINQTVMESQTSERQYNLTSLHLFKQSHHLRKSIGSLPFKKLQLNNAHITQQVLSRRVSLGKTQKRITTRKTVEKNPPPPTTKNLGDKATYFDEFLSDNFILRDYKMMSHIGKGCFSVVSLAIHKETNSHYAIKTYEKIDSLEWYRLEGIRRQIKHLKNLQHPNVIELVHVFKDKKKILMLMQNGGKQSLSGLLRKSKTFSEEQAKFYLKQVIEAMSYCHEKGVCHRDLKPENILVDDSGNVKVIDFGFSASSRVKLKSFCGTPPFMAPELTKKVPYNGAAVDVWALGIMLYQMIVGKLPFRATNQPELYRLIQQGKYPVKENMSKSLKGILDKMLKCSADDRITATDLLKQNWLK